MQTITWDDAREWVSDENGNRCSVAYWGSEAAAEMALLSLIRCSNCADCSYCSRCSGCPSQPATANRSDKYTFAAFRDENGVIRIHAGCRKLSLSEAREHWSRTRGGTPLGAETMAILDYLEKAVALRATRA